MKKAFNISRKNLFAAVAATVLVSVAVMGEVAVSRTSKANTNSTSTTTTIPSREDRMIVVDINTERINKNSSTKEGTGTVFTPVLEEDTEAVVAYPEQVIPDTSRVSSEIEEYQEEPEYTQVYVQEENVTETEYVEDSCVESTYTTISTSSSNYTWADVCSGSFYYCGSDGFTVSSYEMYLLVAITEHEFGYTTSQWVNVDEYTFDYMQQLMASTVINRARYGGGIFGGNSVLSVLEAPGQYMPTAELSYFQLGDPERTFANCLAVLNGSAGVPTNVYWEGSLEGSGCTGVLNGTWYTTPWGSCVAFGYR